MSYRKLIPAALASLVLACAAIAQTKAPIQVDQAWARPTVPGQQAGGGFLAVHNTGSAADKLLGGSTPAAERLELHSMTMEGNVMKMQRVAAIDVPAGQTVELKPGSWHVMLMGLKAPLKAGSSVPVTLKFEKAGEVHVDMKVQATTGKAQHQH